MGVVDEHGKPLPCVNALQPARRAGGIGKAVGHLLRAQAERGDGDRRGAHCVLNIVPADELRAHLGVAVGCVQVEARSGGGSADVARVISHVIAFRARSVSD